MKTIRVALVGALIATLSFAKDQLADPKMEYKGTTHVLAATFDLRFTVFKAPELAKLIRKREILVDYRDIPWNSDTSQIETMPSGTTLTEVVRMISNGANVARPDDLWITIVRKYSITMKSSGEVLAEEGTERLEAGDLVLFRIGGEMG